MSKTDDSTPAQHTSMQPAETQQSSADGSGTHSVADLFRVGVKVPEFWPERPDVWFAQLEAQFALSRIKEDSTKFYHVIANLGNQNTVEVIDIITSPPATQKYEKLKMEIIKRLSASRERKVKQLLVHEELGDRKPSQFLRHLQNLAGPDVPEEFLRTIWSSRLPHNIQTIVASQADLPLDKIADLADKVFELAPSTPQVASTSSSSYDNSLIHDMAKQIAELTRQVTKLSTHRAQYRGRSHSRGRSNSRHSSQPRPCFYHRKFGVNAQKCTKPCNFQAENSRGDRQ